MQELMYEIPLLPLLAFGYLIGIILLILGYREEVDLTRRYHLMGIGTIIIGIMIPTTPVAWYGYWVLVRGLVLGLLEIAFIAISVVFGIVIIYKGTKIYSSPQRGSDMDEVFD